MSEDEYKGEYTNTHTLSSGPKLTFVQLSAPNWTRCARTLGWRDKKLSTPTGPAVQGRSGGTKLNPTGPATGEDTGGETATQARKSGHWRGHGGRDAKTLSLAFYIANYNYDTNAVSV